MKLHKLSCPNCDGILELKIINSNRIYCPYCGQQFLIDDGKREYTTNKNINIHKTIKSDRTYHERYTNDADVIREKNNGIASKLPWIALIVFLLIGFISYLFDSAIPSLMRERQQREEAQAIQEAIDAGKISAGQSYKLIGEDYRTVEAHFEAAGFTNIQLIDLDDSGFEFWIDGDVETISIGGDTSFTSSDYYDPDTKVVISYH